MVQDEAQPTVHVVFPKNARWNYVRQLDDGYVRPQVVKIVQRYVAGDEEITAVQWGEDKRTLGAIVGDNLNIKVDVQEHSPSHFVVISVDVR